VQHKLRTLRPHDHLLLEQVFVDGERSARTLGRGNDGKLHVARHVASDERSGDVGSAVRIASEPALIIMSAAQGLQQRRARMLTSRKEECAPLKDLSASEANRGEAAVVSFQLIDSLCSDRNPDRGKPRI